MSEAGHGLTRREVMTGLGVGAGLALAAPALTAAAAPVTNHVPAWGGGFYQALGATVPGLTYVTVDATAFHPYDYFPGAGGQRRIEDATGVYLINKPGRLATPLHLPVGSVIYQINLSYHGNPIVEVFKRDFVTTPQTWGPVFQQTAPNVPSGTGTHTVNLPTPVTIEQAASYSLQFYSATASSDGVFGMTIGYLPPTAGFVPFGGATPRVYDSRTTGAKLGFQQELVVDLGNPGVRGALFNLTVTDTENGGFVAAFADGVAYPGNSSVNYSGTGQTVANGVVSAVAANGRIKLRGGGPAGAAHVIVDRLGWFI